MAKLLSQEEIDALLVNDNIGDNTIPGVSSQKMVSLYDFRHPDRVSKEQMRALRTIHERFGRVFATYLSSTLRMMVDIKVDSIDQVTYSEYAMSLTTPACIYVIKMENLNGSGLIELSSDLFFILLERQLGGAGKSAIENREVTIIEQKVLEKVIISALGFLNEAWESITPLGCKLESFETNAQFVQIAPPSETVVIIILDVYIKDKTYNINIAIPYYVIEPVMQNLSAQTWIALTQHTEEEDQSAIVRDNILQTEVDLIARLGTADINIKEFLNLQKGDLIRLNEGINDPLKISVNENLKFLGSPGTSGKHKAIEINSIITPEEEGYYI